MHRQFSSGLPVYNVSSYHSRHFAPIGHVQCFNVIALSQPSSTSSNVFARDPEAHCAASSTPRESLMLCWSSSKEVDILSIKAGDVEDSPPPSLTYRSSWGLYSCCSIWLAVKQVAHWLRNPLGPRHCPPNSAELHLMWRANIVAGQPGACLLTKKM